MNQENFKAWGIPPKAVIISKKLPSTEINGVEDEPNTEQQQPNEITEAGQVSPGSQDGTDEPATVAKPHPIIFNDCIARKLLVPWESCKEWKVLLIFPIATTALISHRQ
jgi:hypothetical protein